MGKKLYVIDFFVYRWRYNLGYVAIVLLLVALLTVVGLYTPGGLSDAEITAAAQSGGVSLQHFTPEMVVNLPYYLLQKLSFTLFGVHTFTIKLPSLILATFSVIGALLLLIKWFKRNTAILTTLLAITTGPFLLIAQSGTPAILYIFWPIMILLSGAMLSHNAKFPLLWKLLLFGSIALSLYTPLSLYIIIALLIAGAFHPHVRYVILSLSRWKLALAIVAGLCLLLPLEYSLVQNPGLSLTLLGIPSSLDIAANIQQLANQYLNFLSPSSSLVMTPIYELATIIVIVLGVYRVLTTNYTARGYILMAWVIMITVITLISPNLISITFIPSMLLIGFGIDYLISSWYRLFPRNPYARAAGLVPLVIFIASLSLSGIDRFVYGNLYDPATAHAFSHDLSILDKALAKTPNSSVLVVGSKEKDFYDVVRRYNDAWNIQSVKEAPPVATGSTTVITSQAATRPTDRVPTSILTNGNAEASDRFYIYKNVSE